MAQANGSYPGPAFGIGPNARHAFEIGRRHVAVACDQLDWMADDWNAELSRKPVPAARGVNHVFRVNGSLTRDYSGDAGIPHDDPFSRCSLADLDAECQCRFQKLMIEIETWSLKSLPTTSIVISKGESSVRAYDASGTLLAFYAATIGSEHDPLPLGEWKINGVAREPKFHYNPELFWDAKKSADKQTLPPGPNNPVGLAWIDLSKDHYGIHGTPEPGNLQPVHTQYGT